jgi:hypothetical protein
MRRELRERLGDALGIPKKHWEGLDCIESEDLFAIFKPGGAVDRDSVSEPRLRPEPVKLGETLRVRIY